MNNKLEKTVHDIKTPAVNNPETYVLTHNRFNTHLVLIICDLNKAQICKILYRDSPLKEIEILTSLISWICLSQMKSQKIITLENRTMTIFYSKSEMKNIFTWEKK